MPHNISPDQLQMLHRVLLEAGYKVSEFSDDISTCDVAARLLFQLVNEGITDPVELSRQLEHRFGKQYKMGELLPEVVPNYAIRGLASPDTQGEDRRTGAIESLTS